MTMSAPPSATTHYIMLECGCRGVVAEPLLVHHALVCPKHHTAHTYVLESKLRLPLYTKVSPKRFIMWLGRKPTTQRQRWLRACVCLEIGALVFVVVTIVTHIKLGRKHG